MAAYTSTQSGNWSDTATWGGIGPPGDGDTFTIAAGHTVTVTDDRTFGTAALSIGGTVSATATLTIATGAILRGKNHVLNNGTVTINGQWIHATLATTNEYQLQAGTNCVLNIVGTAQNRAVFKSDTTGGGAGRGNIARSGSTSGHKFTASYADFIDVGDSNTHAIAIYGGTVATAHFSMTNCTATRCGQFFIGSLDDEANFIIEDCDLSTGPVNTSADLVLQWTATARLNASVTRSIQRNHFGYQKAIAWTTRGKGGMTFKHNIFSGWNRATPADNTAFAEWTDNVLWIQRGDAAMAGGNCGDTITRMYGFMDMAAPASAESYFGESWTTTGGTLTFNKCIFDCTVESSSQQVIPVPEPTAGARTYILENSIVLPGPGANHSAGGTFTAHGNRLITVKLRHCTVNSAGTNGNSTGAIGFASPYTGHADWINECRDNIFWARSLPSTYGRILWALRSQQNGSSFYGTVDGTSTATQLDAATITGGNDVFETATNYRLGQDTAAKVYYVTGVNAGLIRDVLTTVDSNSVTHDAFPGAPSAGDQYRIGIVDLVRYDGNMNNARYNVLSDDAWEPGGINQFSTPYTGFWVSDPNSLGGFDIDLSESPDFVDDTRNMMTFASAYLERNATNGGSYGSNGQGAWSAAHGTYSVGNVVSHQVAGFFDNAVCLYRCILAHDPAVAANDEPGTGTAWRTYWEPASLYELRQALATRIPQLIDWVFAGFAPQNTELQAASDNVEPSNGWIGAVEGEVAVATRRRVVTPGARMSR